MPQKIRIYTRTGDAGETGLIGGGRTPKHHLRVEAMGAVDEANAAIGMARLHVGVAADASLMRIQHRLFDLGAELATVEEEAKSRIHLTHVQALEAEVDAIEEALLPLRAFILPGGTAGAAHLHLARTLVRRAERQLVALAAQENVNPLLLSYVNRLSDHLFVLARAENKGEDVLWQPENGQ